LQYVELSLNGAAIQRRRLTIPPSIQNLGGNQDLEGRLRTTFELMEKDDKLSSKPLEDDLNEIRNSLTRSLGKDHGRVVLKAAKPRLAQQLAELRKKLETHQQMVRTQLQTHLNHSRRQIIEYYLPLAVKNPPDTLLGGTITVNGKPSEDAARHWLNTELDRVFPTAESLLDKMVLEERYKDVTFETLNRDDFLDQVKAAYPQIEWEKAYKAFRAAGQSEEPTPATR
jgi:hypothetical protein